ncbi:hypothetical protein CI793_07790 [Anoxybacillus ayderensis]|nr:flagellar hook-length control protein FliK [Anoxybacillus sp. ST70]AXM87883.1 flagellar hook-length control protein FliK [Anoxybacillus ayderensis G10]MBW9217021.1 flagellar hook-length control protein FliK [Anoxybacillus sp. ST70]THD16348.1 hypothetical protein CI793_07790 [Anoxybacillus ayderensis]
MPQNIRACLRKKQTIELKGGGNVNITPVSPTVSFVGQDKQGEVPTGAENVFASVLASLQQLKQPVSQNNFEQQENTELIDWGELQKWLCELPISDGYADRQILSHEIIQSFLSFLPEQAKEYIVEQFSTSQAFEEIFSLKEGRNEEVDEFMLFMALFQLEQKGWSIPEQVMESVRTLFSTTFKVNIGQSCTIKEMLQKLMENERASLSLASNEKTVPDVKRQMTFAGTLLPEQQTWHTVQKNVMPLSKSEQMIVYMPEHTFQVAQQVTEKVVPFEMQTIDTTNETAFAAQLDRVVRMSKFTQLRNGAQQLLVRLHPEHLGFMTIKLIQQKNGLVAKIITSTEMAKQLVERHIHQLSHVIATDRITVEQFNVFEQTKFRDHSFQQQQQQQKQQEKQKEEKRQPDQSFDEWITELFQSER